jgi:hypothetical protein
LIDRRWHSSILDIRSFRGADSDTDHYLVVAEVRERLSARKQAAQRTDVEILISRSLVRGRLGNSFRLKSPTGLKLWRI